MLRIAAEQGATPTNAGNNSLAAAALPPCIQPISPSELLWLYLEALTDLQAGCPAIAASKSTVAACNAVHEVYWQAPNHISSIHTEYVGMGASGMIDELNDLLDLLHEQQFAADSPEWAAQQVQPIGVGQLALAGGCSCTEQHGGTSCVVRLQEAQLGGGCSSTEAPAAAVSKPGTSLKKHDCTGGWQHV